MNLKFLNKKFPCTGCGACCRVVGSVLANKNNVVEPYKSELEAFPYKANAEGHCEKLGDDGKCLVYDDRPTVCDIGKLYDKHFKGKESKKSYFKKTAVSCNQLIAGEDLDEKYLVNL